MARVIIAAVLAVPCLILLLPVFVVAGALSLFAACVRALGRGLEHEFVPWAELMTFDRKLGWKPRAGLDAHYLAERDDVFRVVTDKEGWPGTRSLDESAVVVIGDSFAFGYGVDAGSSFADVQPGVTIKGVGAPGYSMVQSVLLMEQFAERLRGKLVVWFICLENDLEDNLAPSMRRYRAPFVRPSRSGGGWEIADEHVGPEPWLLADVGKRRIFPNLCAPGPLGDRVFAACDYLVGRGAAACNRAGAHLVLVTIPDPSQLTAAGLAQLAELSGKPESCDANLPDRRFAEICGRHGVALVVGKDHLARGDYKQVEGLHWNQQGHRRMAAVLGGVYETFKSGQMSGASAPSAMSADPLPALHHPAAGLR